MTRRASITRHVVLMGSHSLPDEIAEEVAELKGRIENLEHVLHEALNKINTIGLKVGALEIRRQKEKAGG